jgi:hypothetical protein
MVPSRYLFSLPLSRPAADTGHCMGPVGILLHLGLLAPWRVRVAGDWWERWGAWRRTVYLRGEQSRDGQLSARSARRRDRAGYGSD